MIKIFNKKIAKLYIILLCVTLISGIVSSCFCISYSSQFDKETAPEKADTSELLSAAVSALSGNEEGTDALTNMLASAITSNILGSEDSEEQLSKKATELKSKKILTLVLLCVSFFLAIAFFAATITCYEYEKYLESPKYKAKLKRLKKVQKINN